MTATEKLREATSVLRELIREMPPVYNFHFLNEGHHELLKGKRMNGVATTYLPERTLHSCLCIQSNYIQAKIPDDPPKQTSKTSKRSET